MKKILFGAAICVSVFSFAQEMGKTKVGPPEGNALVGDVYGSEISATAEDNAISTTALDKKLKKSKKVENIAVKGKVVDVCDKKGCWITVETANKERFFVKMKDYAFFVPTALKGKNVLLEGSAEEKTISVDELKHYAEDAKKSPAEIAKITKPEQEIRFMASGIKVIN